MNKTEETMLWVVYQMTIHGKPTLLNAVCEQGEWDAMERAQPGHHRLILSGINNEGEAERFARIRPVNDEASKLTELKALRR